MLKNIIHQKNVNKIFTIYEKSGKLPHGYFGKIIFEQHKDKIAILVKKILKYRQFPKKKKFCFQINNYYIYGTLSEICKIGLVKYQPKTLDFQSTISLWIQHLIYCLLERKKESFIFGLKNSNLKFKTITVDSAYYYLSNYLKAYEQGLNEPLLLTISGFEWIKTVFDKKNKYYIP
ncbi:hypothetical protein HIC20_01055 [Buchnera aphidicola (Hormaphis cornu)]|nr:hypothetical protein HIC20_01055 [Buchnera aphidicola (Hormaphis cornu)]